MIPAGIDRDKRIAEIRGELGECIGISCPFPINGNKCVERGNACGHRAFIPYSTDITAAMELLQEMASNGILTAIVTCPWGNGHKTDITMSKNGKGKIGYFVGEEHPTITETTSDAISGCYVKWKETL